MNLRSRGRGRWWWAVLSIVLLPSVFRPRAAPASDAAPRRYLVEIRGMAFQPAVLEVARGDTVVFINRDIVPHNATAVAPHGWKTHDLLQGQEGRHVARTAGETRYRCTFHPVMEGRLIVR